VRLHSGFGEIRHSVVGWLRQTPTTDSLKSASNGYWVALLTTRRRNSWSIKVATLGWGSFVDALVDSEEYQTNFGDTTVPYQRRRFNRPINLVTPRYGNYWREKLETERYKWGDIRNMDMAHFYQPNPVIPKPVQTANIQIPDMTRDNKQGAPVSVNLCYLSCPVIAGYQLSVHSDF